MRITLDIDDDVLARQGLATEGFSSVEPRPLGMFAGQMRIADDFDEIPNW